MIKKWRWKIFFFFKWWHKHKNLVCFAKGAKCKSPPVGTLILWIQLFFETQFKFHIWEDGTDIIWIMAVHKYTICITVIMWAICCACVLFYSDTEAWTPPTAVTSHTQCNKCTWFYLVCLSLLFKLRNSVVFFENITNNLILKVLLS